MKKLASAASYLSFHSKSEMSACFEAIQILHDCSQDVLEENMKAGGDLVGSEDAIWQRAEARWEPLDPKLTTLTSRQAHHAAAHERSAAVVVARPLSHGIRATGLSMSDGGSIDCAECKHHTMTRVVRHSFMARYVYATLGYYPWECGFCLHKVNLRQRSSAEASAAKSKSMGVERERHSITAMSYPLPR
ncbi:hypothetical protein [Acidipila sp. EB88]|uniref:hypothetical protein n=1 Tax=Acidipila sp. EB88 TaxID=2305226 RepID=UPI000F5DB103|nr:hypothetical protein [Acidipila sp. EB88]